MLHGCQEPIEECQTICVPVKESRCASSVRHPCAASLVFLSAQNSEPTGRLSDSRRVGGYIENKGGSGANPCGTGSNYGVMPARAKVAAFSEINTL
jgi:hypothetical protein